MYQELKQPEMPAGAYTAPPEATQVNCAIVTPEHLKDMQAAQGDNEMGPREPISQRDGLVRQTDASSPAAEAKEAFNLPASPEALQKPKRQKRGPRKALSKAPGQSPAEGGEQAQVPGDSAGAKGEAAAAPTASPETAGKPKRKYVKSGKFVGKFNSWKKKQSQADVAATDGTAEKAEGATPAKAPTASEPPAKRKRGRPVGSKNQQKLLQAEGLNPVPPADNAHTNEVTAEDAEPIQPAKSHSRRKAAGSTANRGVDAQHQRAAGPSTDVALKPEAGEAGAPEADQAAEVVQASSAKPEEAEEAAAGPSTDSMAVMDSRAGAVADSTAGAVVDSRPDGGGADTGAMARMASLGDGSRLVRPCNQAQSDVTDSSVEPGGAAQSALSPRAAAAEGPRAAANALSPQHDEGQGKDQEGPDTADKPRHRLSRVTGRDVLKTNDHTVDGETKRSLHRNDSTFGEYMASLDRRSSSNLGRKVHGSGNSERLLEMLHGSDGLGKLVSELQHKEEEEARVQQTAALEGQRAGKRKRGCENKPNASGAHAIDRDGVSVATSEGSTEDSRASRPRRARMQFDYSILNGTSGNLGAILQAAEPESPKVKRKKRQSKLDQNGNKPEVSIYAKAYNKVKAQFVRIRMEETLLSAYGADGARGGSDKRIKLQAEMARADKQVEKCKTVIRECVKFCEDAEGDKAIPRECYDSDGELPEKHIFCGKCQLGTSEEDNDIVLCDGDCGRAYHEQCLQPRIHVNELPEDEGWLCHACDAKADIILAINEEFGTDYSEEAPWHSLFAEDASARGKLRGQFENGAGAGPSGPVSFLDMDLGKSDSDDSSFGSEDMSDADAAQQHCRHSAGTEQSSDSVADSDVSSTCSSNSDATSDSAGSSDSGSADLEEEEQEDAAGIGDDAEDVDISAPRAKRARAVRPTDTADRLQELSGTSGLATSEGTSDIVAGKRKRQQIDYKALNESMFGNAECYEGEGLEEGDAEYALPVDKRRKEHGSSD